VHERELVAIDALVDLQSVHGRIVPSGGILPLARARESATQ
jgi:hypothetical protein